MTSSQEDKVEKAVQKAVNTQIYRTESLPVALRSLALKVREMTLKEFLHDISVEEISWASHEATTALGNLEHKVRAELRRMKGK